MKIIFPILRVFIGVLFVWMALGWLLFILGFWGLWMESFVAIGYAATSIFYAFFLFEPIFKIGYFLGIKFYHSPIGIPWPIHEPILAGAVASSIYLIILLIIYKFLKSRTKAL